MQMIRTLEENSVISFSYEGSNAGLWKRSNLRGRPSVTENNQRASPALFDERATRWPKWINYSEIRCESNSFVRECTSIRRKLMIVILSSPIRESVLSLRAKWVSNWSKNGSVLRGFLQGSNEFLPSKRFFPTFLTYLNMDLTVSETMYLWYAVRR